MRACIVRDLQNRAGCHQAQDNFPGGLPQLVAFIISSYDLLKRRGMSDFLVWKHSGQNTSSYADCSIRERHFQFSRQGTKSLLLVNGNAHLLPPGAVPGTQDVIYMHFSPIGKRLLGVGSVHGVFCALRFCDSPVDSDCLLA